MGKVDIWCVKLAFGMAQPMLVLRQCKLELLLVNLCKISYNFLNANRSCCMSIKP